MSIFISCFLLILFNININCYANNKHEDTIAYLNLDDTTVDSAYILNINRTECEGKLLLRNAHLKDYDIEILCDSLIKHAMFFIRISQYHESSPNKTLSLEASSQKFFEKICIDFPLMCYEGVLVDLYTEEKKIILNFGIKAKKLVSDIYQARVIETVQHDLISQNLTKALDEVVRLLDYKLKGGHSTLNQRQSNEPGRFIWHMLLPSLIIIYGLLFLLIYLLSKGYMNFGLFYFMDKILDNWEEINNSSEKRIQLPPNTCLFCMKSGTNTFKFLYCNHSYHYRCLYSWQLNSVKCCPCSYIAVEGEESGKINFTRPANLTFEDIKLILGYILDAYRKQNVYDYFIENEEKIKNINEKYNISFEEMCWIHTNKLACYKSYRIFHHVWTTLKMMFCVLTFYPSDLFSSKNNRMTRKSSNVHAKERVG